MAHETNERMKKFIKLNLSMTHLNQLGINATDIWLLGGSDCIIDLINRYSFTDLVTRLGLSLSNIRSHPNYRSESQLRQLYAILELTPDQVRMMRETAPRPRGLIDSTCGSTSTTITTASAAIKNKESEFEEYYDDDD
jgi:hypothetical protein